MPSDAKDKATAAPGGSLSPPAPAVDDSEAPAVIFEASPALEAHVDKELHMAALKCPQCDGPTEPYVGPNPHKQGSYECKRCQVRIRPQ